MSDSKQQAMGDQGPISDAELFRTRPSLAEMKRLYDELAVMYDQKVERIESLLEQLEASERERKDLAQRNLALAECCSEGNGCFEQLEAANAEIAKLRRWFGMTEPDSSPASKPFGKFKDMATGEVAEYDYVDDSAEGRWGASSSKEDK